MIHQLTIQTSAALLLLRPDNSNGRHMAVDANDDSSAAAAKMEDSLWSLVQYYLENLMHANATFLGERLVACNPREENVLLLATCHVMNKSKLTAHALLQGCRLPESRWGVIMIGQNMSELVGPCIGGCFFGQVCSTHTHINLERPSLGGGTTTMAAAASR